MSVPTSAPNYPLRRDVLLFVVSSLASFMGFFFLPAAGHVVAGQSGLYVGALAGASVGALGGFLYVCRAEPGLRYVPAGALVLFGSLVSSIVLFQLGPGFMLTFLVAGGLAVLARRLFGDA